MKKLIVRTERWYHLDDMPESDLTVYIDWESGETEYQYDTVDECWFETLESGEQEKVDAIKHKELVKELDTKLKQQIEQLVNEDYQENIEYQITNESNCDAEFIWDTEDIIEKLKEENKQLKERIINLTSKR